jgi:energy-coupling factor transporter ATP-binding protein EcfA2
VNPLRLHVRNYRCFELLDLQLPDGCVAILGHNGEGKSSIAESIEVALFGECRTGRLPAQLARAAGPDDELLVELELEHVGALYRIRRTYSARGRGKTTLDFEQFEGEPTNGDGEHVEELGGFVPLTRGSAKETQELIEQTLGLNRETFRASAFLAQGDGAAFTDAAPRDRKRILANVHARTGARSRPTSKPSTAAHRPHASSPPRSRRPSPSVTRSSTRRPSWRTRSPTSSVNMRSCRPGIRRRASRAHGARRLRRSCVRRRRLSRS